MSEERIASLERRVALLEVTVAKLVKKEPPVVVLTHEETKKTVERAAARVVSKLHTKEAHNNAIVVVGKCHFFDCPKPEMLVMQEEELLK